MIQETARPNWQLGVGGGAAGGLAGGHIGARGTPSDMIRGASFLHKARRHRWKKCQNAMSVPKMSADRQSELPWWMCSASA